MWARARSALGLRGRIIGAVLVTAVATLVVAALALLGPLEHSLRNAEKGTLEKELTGAKTTAPFRNKKLDPGLLLNLALAPPPATTTRSKSGGAAASPGSGTAAADELKLYRNGVKVRRSLLRAEDSLLRTSGATEVALLGYADVSGHHARPVLVSPDSDTAKADPYGDVATAFRTERRSYTFRTIGDTEYVQAMIPFSTTGPDPAHWVLAVRKPLDTVSGAVSTVRRAFLEAALAALALTLVLGIPLSATMVRRLRRLRHAALQLADEGPPVRMPVDRRRDEVGDLSRAFATMQRRLQQQEEARRAFVSTASHELRTPLASLDGMLELLDEDLAGDDPDLEDAHSLLERARSQSRRLARLAADLLDLSRLDAQVQMRSEAVELGELSRAVLAEFELGTSDRGIECVLDDAVGRVWACGDPGGIARIVRILLDNAVRVSPERGEITVTLRGGEHASLTVHDQGPGVSETECELIFERFQRGRGASGTAGFGLGLAIGRELAHRMGGELLLEQNGLPGATFTLRLPVAQAQQEEPIAVV